MRERATIDYAVVAIYLLIVIGVSLRVTRRAPNAEETLSRPTLAAIMSASTRRSTPRRPC